MRRKTRIDLGQTTTRQQDVTKSTQNVDDKLERRRKRWAVVNKGRNPDENPFLAAIKPVHGNYGDPGESAEELRARLDSLEFGNYPGYFNYRNKATSQTHTLSTSNKTCAKSCELNEAIKFSSSDSSLATGLDDERLRLMKADWFRNKSVLDIGCNRGHVTYAIAKMFSPRFILGIDIDLKMVHMANRDLHLHLEDSLLQSNLDYRIKRAHELNFEDDEKDGVKPLVKEGGEKGIGEDVSKMEAQNIVRGVKGDDRKQYIENDEQHFTLSSYVAQGPIATLISGGGGTNCDHAKSGEIESKSEDVELVRGEDEKILSNYNGKADSDHLPSEDHQPKSDAPSNMTSAGGCTGRVGKNSFPNNILFVEHNYVLAKDELVEKQKASFDTVVCLSVTKWIHLNYRDDGLKRFFKRIYNHLNDGGLLVLEAQPFDNYHRKKKLSDRLRSNFNSIKFKPDQFDEFLLSDQVGFKEIVFSTTTEHECVGFKRPLKVFSK